MTRSQLETTIELAALNPQDALNPAFPIRESYIQGLQAVTDLTDDPEEAEEFQAQAMTSDTQVRGSSSGQSRM